MSDLNKPSERHPDARQDEQQIRFILGKLLVPVLMKLEGRMKELGEKVEGANSVLTKMIMGFDQAMTNQEKKALMEELNSTYGPDIEGLKGIYSDIHDGRDIMSDFVEEVLKVPGDGRMDFAKNMLEKAKGKYGKYAPKAVEVEITSGVLDPEGKEKAGEPLGKDSEEPDEMDLADRLMAGLSGKR